MNVGSSRQGNANIKLNPALIVIIAFMLLFAPLMRGGNRPLPLLVLELAAVSLLVLLLLRPPFVKHLPWPMLGAFALLLLYPLLQLVPLPFEFWSQLPGRDYYAEQLSVLGLSGPQTISLIPLATESAWLALLPPLLVFVAVVGLPTKSLRFLLLLFMGLALGQALLGLFQYGQGHSGPLRLGMSTDGANVATGSYVNRNHLAGLLEMALPITCAFFVNSFATVYFRAQARRTLRQKLSYLFAESQHRTVLTGTVLLALLLGLIFTRSRAGIGLGILGLIICAIIFARSARRPRLRWLLFGITGLSLAVAFAIGLAPVLERFLLLDFLGPGRWLVYTSTWDAIREFFPLGSGFGTFAEVYHRFHDPGLLKFVNRAHNDYLEWILEGGAIVTIAMLMLLIGYLQRWTSVLGLLAQGREPEWVNLQIGAGIGLLLLSLHSLVDFNLHIPANAIYFAFLGAVFWHQPEQQPQTPSKTRKHRTARPQQPIPPENTVNPFAT